MSFRICKFAKNSLIGISI